MLICKHCEKWNRLLKSLSLSCFLKTVQKFKIVSLSYTCIPRYLTFVHSQCKDFLEIELYTSYSQLSTKERWFL